MLPAALRFVLEALVKDADGYSDEGDDWRNDWKEYCKSGLGFSDGPPGLTSEDDEKSVWVDDVVKKFSRKHSFLKRIRDLKDRQE